MSSSSDNSDFVYLERSRLRFDMSIREGCIFGPERDRFCRHMFETSDVLVAGIDPWQMWKRVSSNAVACKFCRLYTDSGYIRHECGWWEHTGQLDGMICFCFCHDDLGYVLNDGDSFVFCDSWVPNNMERLIIDDETWEFYDSWVPITLRRLQAMWGRVLLRANQLRLHIVGRAPNFRITYIACRDGDLILSDHDTGSLHPSQILWIGAFSGFIVLYRTFKAKIQVYRGTALGQYMTMQSKRYLQRSSKSLWILSGDKEFAIIVHLELLCLRAIARARETAIAEPQKNPSISDSDAACMHPSLVP